MDTLVHDGYKVKNFGPAIQNDTTAKIELQIQRRLLELKKKNLILVRVYEDIRPGLSAPTYVWLAKNPQERCSSEPHLVHGSVQHQLAKWFTSVFNPVLQLFLRTVYMTLSF